MNATRLTRNVMKGRMNSTNSKTGTMNSFKRKSFWTNKYRPPRKTKLSWEGATRTFWRSWTCSKRKMMRRVVENWARN